MSADTLATEWREATAGGRLKLRVCRSCERAHHYPRRHCPLCGSPATAWQDASGRGTIYAKCVTLRADPPYCIAYVKLDEGPLILTNIVGCDMDRIAIGQAVRVCGGAHGVPVFTPGEAPG